MSFSVVAFFLSVFLLFSSAADAFNITQILSGYPDLTAFNNLLTQTGVGEAINREQTVTVLVVANANMTVSGLSQEQAKKLMSVHVILDYYDEIKFLEVTVPVTVTTLYQKSGLAQNNQGFLNMSRAGRGGTAIGSAAPGSTENSLVIKRIDEEPYSIAVWQVTNLIDLGASNSNTPSSAPAQAPAKSPENAPAKSPVAYPPGASPPRKVLAPAPAPNKSESPAASSPANKPNPSNNATAPAASSPANKPPTSNATAPATASPPKPNGSNATAPSNSEAPEPEAASSPSLITPVADGPAPALADRKSAAVSLTSGNHLAWILVILTSAWLLLAVNI